MNKDEIAAETQHLHMLKSLSTISDIEDYTEYLMSFLQQLIEMTVLLVKPEKEYACSW